VRTQVLENRLFSEGLHVLGQAPSQAALSQYLSAYFDDALPQEAVDMIAGREERGRAERAQCALLDQSATESADVGI
jgi:magnesium chelatase subunit H